MEKKLIITIVVTLAIVVGIGAALLPVFASPVIILDYNQLDLESPSTETTPVPINDNAQQEALQKIANEHYKEMEQCLVDLSKIYKVSDFCPELVISQVTTSGETETILNSKTGFYVGPVMFFDDKGNQVGRTIILAVDEKINSFGLPNEYMGYTVITLDEINQQFKNTCRYFEPE